MSTVYGCFIKYKVKGWKFSDIAPTLEDRDRFVLGVISMINDRMLGDQPIDYKVVELN